MSRAIAVVAAVVFPVIFIACGDTSKPSPQTQTTSSATASASVAASSPSASASVRLVGPAPSGSSTPAAREAEVMALLSGASSAGSLPTSATDPGRNYDRRLAQMMGLSSFHSSNVEVAPYKVKGPMTPDHVAGLNALNPRWHTCFESALAASPKLTGTLVVKVNVEPDGSIKSAAKSGGTLTHAAMIDCVVRSFNAVKLASESAASEVTVELKFGT